MNTHPVSPASITWRNFRKQPNESSQFSKVAARELRRGANHCLEASKGDAHNCVFVRHETVVHDSEEYTVHFVRQPGPEHPSRMKELTADSGPAAPSE